MDKELVIIICCAALIAALGAWGLGMHLFPMPTGG